MWFKKPKEPRNAELFSNAWLNEWKISINRSDEYKKAGTGWNAPLILKFESRSTRFEDEEAIGFYLDLKSGICDTLRYATTSDIPKTDIVLSAPEEVWINLIKERKDPLMLIMKKQLKLEKGSYVLLSAHHQSAKTLLHTAPADHIHIENESVQAKTSTVINKSKNTERSNYVSTTRGLDHESFPMKLFQKSKRLGIWNPADISFKKDAEQWKTFTPEEQGILIHLSALFMAGEEAVTLDLLPLIKVVASEQRIEEEIYLTSFLWEEAKHMEFFSLFVNQVMDRKPDFNQYHKPLYKKVFYEKLPNTLRHLDIDNSALSQLRASITYNMIVEGTLAETGYEAYFNMLEKQNLLPGLRKGLINLKQDESRHIAFGLYFINRLLSENPELRPQLEIEIETLLTDATNVIHEIFEQYEIVPFNLEKEWFLNYAIKQFQSRMIKIGFK